MNRLYFLCGFLPNIWLSYGLTIQPRVETENGVVIGKYSTSHYGKQFQSFLGIPYAKPPVGSRRFKEPERLDEVWTGEWNATSYGSSCLQLDHFTKDRDAIGQVTHKIIGDEDCLFLNVFTHDKGSRNKDVLVVIHGGAFMFGSGMIYGPEYIMDNEDIVFVTLNYRLGPLGFLTTGDNFVPGNNGLKDQVAALQWVQRNIAGFGGDPQKVTLIGLSAGGASVHYHFISPLSDGLFKRGYSYSGTVLAPWALVRNGVQRSKQLGKYLGCPTTDSKVLVKCLRKRPAKKIVEQVTNFQPWLYNPYTVFGPVVEVGSSNPFIDQHPRDLLKQGKVKDLPWITGVTSEEGLYPAADYLEYDHLLNQLNERWSSLSPDIFFYSDQKNIAEEIKKVFLGGKNVTSSQTTKKELLQLLSDRLFIASAVEAAILQGHSNTAPVYLYMYRYQGTRSLSVFLSDTDTILGVCHGDDIMYLIKFLGLDSHVTSDDKAMAKILNNILLTFAKTGKAPDSLNWKPVSTEVPDDGRVAYLNILSPSSNEMRTDSDIGNLKKIQAVFRDDYSQRDEL